MSKVCKGRPCFCRCCTGCLDQPATRRTGIDIAAAVPTSAEVWTFPAFSGPKTLHVTLFFVTWPCSYATLRHVNWTSFIIIIIIIRGQKKHFSIHIKDMLKKSHIPPDQLEVLAANQDTRHATCKHRLTIFYSSHTADAKNRHAGRHATRTSSSGPTCHICSRFCASDFGLHSHLSGLDSL